LETPTPQQQPHVFFGQMWHFGAIKYCLAVLEKRKSVSSLKITTTYGEKGRDTCVKRSPLLTAVPPSQPRGVRCGGAGAQGVRSQKEQKEGDEFGVGKGGLPIHLFIYDPPNPSLTHSPHKFLCCVITICPHRKLSCLCCTHRVGEARARSNPQTLAALDGQLRRMFIPQRCPFAVEALSAPAAYNAPAVQRLTRARAPVTRHEGGRVVGRMLWFRALQILPHSKSPLCPVGPFSLVYQPQLGGRDTSCSFSVTDVNTLICPSGLNRTSPAHPEPLGGGRGEGSAFCNDTYLLHGM